VWKPKKPVGNKRNLSYYQAIRAIATQVNNMADALGAKKLTEFQKTFDQFARGVNPADQK
jgi:hypothetical protein